MSFFWLIAANGVVPLRNEAMKLTELELRQRRWGDVCVPWISSRRI